MSKYSEISGCVASSFDRTTIKKVNEPSSIVAYATSFEDDETGEEMIFAACSKKALVRQLLESEVADAVEESRIHKVLLVPYESADLSFEC